MTYVDTAAQEVYASLRHPWTDEDGEWGFVALSPETPTAEAAAQALRQFIIETTPEEAGNVDVLDADCVTLGWAEPVLDHPDGDHGFRWVAADSPDRRFRMWRVDVWLVWAPVDAPAGHKGDGA